MDTKRTPVVARERLAAADPADAAWQRYVAVGYLRIAQVLERADIGGWIIWWQRAYTKLSALKQSGVVFSAQDERLLEQLRRELGR